MALTSQSSSVKSSIRERIAIEEAGMVLPDVRVGFWIHCPHPVHVRADCCHVEGDYFIFENAREDHYRSDGTLAFSKNYPKLGLLIRVVQNARPDLRTCKICDSEFDAEGQLVRRSQYQRLFEYCKKHGHRLIVT